MVYQTEQKDMIVLKFFNVV